MKFITPASLLLAAVITAGAASTASAQILTAYDQGNYDQFGFTDPTYTGYTTGIYDTNPEFRSYFVFDRSMVSGWIDSAVLQVWNPDGALDYYSGFVSSQPTETLSLFDVSTDIPSLLDGSVDAFADLGSGTGYGAKSVSLSDNGQWVSIALNSAFLSAINSTSGSIAIGGALTTLDDPNGLELIFAASGDAPYARLVVTAVPEPSTYGLIGGAVLLAGVCLRRRTRAKNNAKSV